MSIATPHRDHPVQDVSQQLRTYHGFLRGLRFIVLHFMVIVPFLVLAFCTGAGFWGGAFVALIILAIGLYLLHKRSGESWPSQFGSLFISTSADSGHEIEDMVRAEGGRVPGDSTLH